MTGFITADGADYLMGLFGGVRDLPSNYYLALVNSPVGTSESGEELSEMPYPDYQRVMISLGPENWTVAYGTLTNTAGIYMPIPTVDDWIGVSGWAICDSELDGKVLFAGDDEPYDVAVGEQVVFPPGSVTLAIDLYGWRETS